MSKETIKIELNGKIICQKKFEKSEKLKLIREKIKDKIGKAFFVDKDNNLLELTDEEDFICSVNTGHDRRLLPMAEQ